MISFLSLITLYLRLSLAIQGGLGVYSVQDQSGDQLHCQTNSATQESLYSDPNWFEGNISLVRKLENEERVEAESDSFLDFQTDVSLEFLSTAHELVPNSEFSTKAIRGSLPPLYDIFHSWKIHLS
ncbi:MAG: hypothetical protein MUE75_00730 [Algoriphagus sp.]|jgi:hypothetical protein|nr:hypothetical protein [Algoriphagus sp.]